MPRRDARAVSARRRARALRGKEGAVNPFPWLLLLGIAAAHAEQADSAKPIEIEANRMSADDARRMNVFEGNVVVTRGTLNIRADRIVVRQDAEGNQYATATGAPVRFRQRQDAKPPEKEGVWLEGEARRIELDDKSGKIELFEAARVNRGGDEVAGDYILVDQKSDFFTVTPGRGSGGRVRAILQPKPPEK
ncbi:MAG: lipopolysaccharide transport periplasmic protein LptA [Betaproteobacteria bacterium]|nr:MAG: lipopolysaccharide transport periplasmic protein LptA [Betaproteobacteria bacterium]